MASPIFEAAKPIADALKVLGASDDLSDEQVYTSRLWPGLDLYLVGGAITTQEIFSRFDDSLAHLMDDGRIMCYGEQIGTAEDLCKK